MDSDVEYDFDNDIIQDVVEDLEAVLARRYRTASAMTADEHETLLTVIEDADVETRRHMLAILEKIRIALL